MGMFLNALEVVPSAGINWGTSLGQPAQTGITEAVVQLLPYCVPVFVLFLSVKVGPKIIKHFAK